MHIFDFFRDILVLVPLVVFLGVKFGFRKSCLCKRNDKYEVWFDTSCSIFHTFALHRTELFDQFPNYWTASRLKSLSTLVTPLATRQQSKAIATAATTDARHNDSSSIGDCRRHCGSSWAFELLPPVGNCCHHQLSWKIWTAAVHWLPRTAAGPRQIHFHNFNKYSFSIEQMLHSTDRPHLLIHPVFFPIISCT